MYEGLLSLSWYVIFAFALNGLLAIVILILRNRPFRITNVLLAVNLLGFTLAPIMISLVESGLILEIPHFFRLPSPVYYASFPAGYLYVRMVLRDETKLRWWDYLHFLPAILHLVEMVPFYFMDTQSKITHIHFVIEHKIEIYAHNEGWLPPFIHNILRGISALTYGLLMGGLLRKFRKRGPIHPFAKNMVRWLRLFAIDNTLMGVLLIVLLTFLFIPNEIRFIMLSGFLFFGLLTANFFLFLRPDILYGIPQPLPNSPGVAEYEENGEPGTEKEKRLSGVNDLTEIPTFIFGYSSKIDTFLLESKRYLDPFFNIQDLAREAGIPKHHLHLLIHKAEQKSFVEFINGYRILHIKHLIEQGELSNKTLEALAAESGFSSKATFFRTIKKSTGKTPKNYLTSKM